MGKHLFLTVTIFFFILALSHARPPLDLPENEVVLSDLATDLTESHPRTITAATKTIVLPSEKPETESEPVTVVDIESKNTQPGTAESEINQPGTAESETNELQPLTVINFRPLNRQFPRRPSFTLRHRRPCRQHRFGKPWGPTRFPHGEIPYGNDMLMSSSSEEKEAREIPARWVKFHHRDMSGPKFPYWRDDGVARGEDFRRLRHFHRHHHHRHHMEEEEKEDREGHEHERGFFVKIRKFLNHF